MALHFGQCPRVCGVVLLIVIAPISSRAGRPAVTPPSQMHPASPVAIHGRRRSSRRRSSRLGVKGGVGSSTNILSRMKTSTSAFVCSFSQKRSSSANRALIDASRSRLACFTRSRAALLKSLLLQQVEQRQLVLAKPFPRRALLFLVEALHQLDAAAGRSPRSSFDPSRDCSRRRSPRTCAGSPCACGLRASISASFFSTMSRMS